MPPRIDQQYLHKVYRPIIIAMLLCGFNIDASKHVLGRIAFTIYAGVLLGVISYSTMTCCPSQEISFIWQLLEYDIFVIIMLFYKSDISVSFNKITSLDTYLRVNRRHYFIMRRRMCFAIVFIWLLSVAYAAAYCILHTCFTYIGKFIIYEMLLLALDINRVWRYYLFEEVWRRLKLLRTRLKENPDSDFYLYVKDQKTVKENKFRFGLQLYKAIADFLDMISPKLNASLFVSIVCSLPILIVNVYRLLLVFDGEYSINASGFMLVHIMQTSVFIFSPCVVIEMYGAEVEKIRLYLMHRLICTKDMTEMLDVLDAEAKEDIQLFLQYTVIRPFQYKVWRAVPMDLSLPLQILSLCTTYVIVIVNFTKVFD